ncbi:hypothetical protein D9M68_717150 [compost metagenome]
MKNAKVTLEYIFHPKVTIDANQDFDPNLEDDIPTEPEVAIHIGKLEDESTMQVIMTISLTAKESDPYSIELTSVGRFIGNSELSKDEKVKAIIQSAPNILYGAAREFILTITCRSAYRDYVLTPKVFEPSDFIFPAAD